MSTAALDENMLPYRDRVARLEARVRELETERDKWEFKAKWWRDQWKRRANEAEADNERLRGALIQIGRVEIWTVEDGRFARDIAFAALDAGVKETDDE